MSPRTSSSRGALQDLQYSATPLTTLRVTSAQREVFKIKVMDVKPKCESLTKLTLQNKLLALKYRAQFYRNVM